jgi:hypothetical protein
VQHGGDADFHGGNAGHRGGAGPAVSARGHGATAATTALRGAVNAAGDFSLWHAAEQRDGVPLHLLQWPSSPSPIPSWALGSASASIYTAAMSSTLFVAISSTVPSIPTSGVLYGAPDGAMYYRGTSSSSAPAPFGGGNYDAPTPGTPTLCPNSTSWCSLPMTTAPLTLNWLNQCDQFFRGQHTLASNRTWLASYHLRGAAQTWYYALEQAKGMPTWERFKELCNFRFGLAVRGS